MLSRFGRILLGTRPAAELRVIMTEGLTMSDLGGSVISESMGCGSCTIGVETREGGVS
jgi:hypothetical protein